MIISLAGPTYLVVRYNRIGILLGAIMCWAILLVWGEMLVGLDPESRTPFTRLAQNIWIITGWGFGLVYGALVYGVKKLYLASKQKDSYRGAVDESTR